MLLLLKYILVVFYWQQFCLALTDLDIEADEDDLFEYEIGSMETFLPTHFLMGTNDDDSFKQKLEYPVHKEYVGHFRIDRYPVTNIDFDNYVREHSHYTTQPDLNKYSFVFRQHISKNEEDEATDIMVYDEKFSTAEPWMIPVVGARWDKPYGRVLNLTEFGLNPVVHVSLADADAYCHHLGKRLPTEYEWEMAARANNHTSWRYPWGYGMRRGRMNSWQGLFPLHDHGYDGYRAQTAPVNGFPPQNDRGLYDMLGNVWEWTTTEYGGLDLLKQQHDDPSKWYTLKGGSFLESIDIETNSQDNSRLPVRISSRLGRFFEYTAENVGFRCAQTVSSIGDNVINGSGTRPRHISYNETYEYRQRVQELSRKFIRLREKIQMRQPFKRPIKSKSSRHAGKVVNENHRHFFNDKQQRVEL